MEISKVTKMLAKFASEESEITVATLAKKLGVKQDTVVGLLKDAVDDGEVTLYTDLDEELNGRSEISIEKFAAGTGTELGLQLAEESADLLEDEDEDADEDQNGYDDEEEAPTMTLHNSYWNAPESAPEGENEVENQQDPEELFTKSDTTTDVRDYPAGSTSNGSSGTCRICGKPLSQEVSVIRGMGPVCYGNVIKANGITISQLKTVPEAQLVQLIAKAAPEVRVVYQTVAEAETAHPEGIMLVKDLFNMAVAQGAKGLRVINAHGGIHGNFEKFSPNWTIFLVKGIRYVSKTALAEVPALIAKAGTQSKDVAERAAKRAEVKAASDADRQARATERANEKAAADKVKAEAKAAKDAAREEARLAKEKAAEFKAKSVASEFPITQEVAEAVG